MAKKDLNQLAKSILDIVTGETKDSHESKKPSTVVKGRAGGKIGGKARAANLTDKKRSEIASKAANIRWGKKT